MTTWVAPKTLDMTQATPLSQVKQVLKDAGNIDKPADEKAQVDEVNSQWRDMFIGNVSGSLGETSGLCWLIGGVFLLVRRTITVHIMRSLSQSVTDSPGSLYCAINIIIHT